MKFSLFFILLLAVIISLCGCKPPAFKKYKCEESIPFLNKEHIEHSDEEKTASGKLKHPKLIKSAMKHAGRPKNIERRVSFNENVDICKKSTSSLDDDSGIFWLSYKNFAPIITKKCELFPVDTTERVFITLIQNCIERNYAMFNFLYRSASKFSNYDSYVCPIEENIDGEPILFPNSTKFMESKATRENVEQTIIEILDDLIPAYELNENLLNLVQHMNKKTKIDPNVLDKLYEEDDKIVAVWESFLNVFETFSLDEYMQGLSEIRRTINHLEFKKINLDEANKRLNISLEKLCSNAPQINEALTWACFIEFESLEQATNAIYSYAIEALKVAGAFPSK